MLRRPLHRRRRQLSQPVRQLHRHLHPLLLRQLNLLRLRSRNRSRSQFLLPALDSLCSLPSVETERQGSWSVPILEILAPEKTTVKIAYFEGDFDAGGANLNELEPKYCGKMSEKN